MSTTTLDALTRAVLEYGVECIRVGTGQAVGHEAQAKFDALQSALSEALALTRCACGDSFTKADPGKCVNCRAADGESLADKVQPAMTDQQATLLNQAHDLLLAHADAQRALGNDSAANGAECSADAVLKMAAAWSAAPPVAPAAPVAKFTEDEFFTLVGHASWLEMEGGQRDMPSFFLALAAKYAPDRSHAKRAEEMRSVMLAAAPPAPAAAPAEGARWLPIGPVTEAHTLECLIVLEACRQSDGDWWIGGSKFIDGDAPLAWMPDTSGKRAFFPAAPTEAPNEQA